jgi:hypothetical protein
VRRRLGQARTIFYIFRIWAVDTTAQASLRTISRAVEINFLAAIIKPAI